MNFSFGTTAGASQSTTKPRLAGNEIYDVQFDGCEIQDIKGVQDVTQLYKVLKLKFSNEDGTFEHTIFEPRESDFERTEKQITDKNGNSQNIPQSSGVENMMLLFKHAIDIINPAIAKEINDGTKNLGAKNWDDLRKLVVKILDAGIGTKFQIKLLKNKKGEASFPGFFVGISREGKAYIKNNFMGTKLAFTPYEADRISKEATAIPTKASTYRSLDNALDGLEEPKSVDLNLDFDMVDL